MLPFLSIVLLNGWCHGMRRHKKSCRGGRIERVGQAPLQAQVCTGVWRGQNFQVPLNATLRPGADMGLMPLTVTG